MADQDDGIQLPTVTDGGDDGDPSPAGSIPTIEGYRVTAPLGRGGMGTVWRAGQPRQARGGGP